MNALWRLCGSWPVSTLNSARNACRPLTTVKTYLESVGAANVLRDPRLVLATAEIDGSPDRPRAAIQTDLACKEAARKALARTHATAQCPPDDLLTAVYSLSDYNTYLLFNRDPVERMTAYLKRYFDPRKADGPHASLAISSGAPPSSAPAALPAGGCMHVLHACIRRC